jgi:hypothetical protein
MRASRCRWPFVQFAIMGSGYAGDRVADAISPLRKSLFS